MRPLQKSTFALMVTNRGFFPAELTIQARRELIERLKQLGHDVIIPDENATENGAVNTAADAEQYAQFFKENEGRYDGVILTLPNFGDESTCVNALKHVTVPIYIHAYPDELDRMSPQFRRDAFCGKFSVMDVFYQYGLPFTVLKPHVVAPAGEDFAANIDHFDKLCRIVTGFKDMVVGAVGARTTAFKTVRIDELALQKHGITMEVIDLSEVFSRMDTITDSTAAYKEKAQTLRDYTNFDGTPDEAFDKIVRLGIVLDALFEEWNLDAMGFRCWIELQRQLNISCCVLLSEMNDRRYPVACEVDIGNAVAMYALQRASMSPTACLDWNNNYGDDPDKCILFHCGSTAQSLMTAKGRIVDHSMLQHDPQVGPNKSFGCNEGRIRPFPFGFASMTTRDGQLDFYLGSGRFTDDPIPDEYFGCGGVAQIENLQDILLYVGRNGFRHHVSITPGENLIEPLAEALHHYLGFNVTVL